MLDVFHIAKPQGCDIQTFYGNQSTANFAQYSWTKPRGISNIYMLLIGGGGNGNGTNGGGSGAVTVWYGSAQNVPDNLLIYPSRGGNQDTTVRYQTSISTPVILLTAQTATTSVAGAATAANQFAASGFYQSIAGQAGSTSDQTASATTFLSGGNGPGGIGVITANYGYSRGPGSGFFQLQPIIVGVGGCNGSGSRGGIGCGSDASAVAPGATGGPGMVLIASW